MFVILKGCGERLDREHNANAWLAWHVAALIKTKKRFPPLKELQVKKPKRVRRKSPEEMIAVAHLWTAATRH